MIAALRQGGSRRIVETGIGIVVLAVSGSPVAASARGCSLHGIGIQSEVSAILGVQILVRQRLKGPQPA